MPGQAKKRPQGDGSIVHRKDGRWMYSERKGRDPKTGRLVRVTLYARTRPLLMQKLQDERAKGSGVVKKRQAPPAGTVGAYITEWLETKIKPNRSPSTYTLYKMLNRLYIEPEIGTVKLVDFDDTVVERLYSGLREKTTRSNIEKVARLGRAVFNERQRKKHIPNPFLVVDMPTHAAKPVRVLTRAEGQKFLKEANATPLAALWYLLATAGLRIGEALALEWRDVDFERGEVRVRENLSEVGGILEFRPPKTDRSKRSVPLTKPTLAALRRHKRERERSGVVSELVFVTPVEGKAWRRSNLRQREFDPLLKRAGLPPVTLHSLRHFAATMLAESTTDLKTITELLGQSRPSTSLAHYVHSSDEGKRAAVARQDKHLRRRAPRQ